MSNTHNPLNPEYTQDGERRIRTKVACDYCRKRKSKCDGEEPCSKCISRKRECTYSFTPKERKKRITTSDSNDIKKPHKMPKQKKTIEELNSRISLLESLVTKLVSNLDPSDKMGIYSQMQRTQELSAEQDSGANMSDEEMDGSTDSSSSHKESGYVLDSKSMKEMLRPLSSFMDKDCVAKKAMKRVAEYCGAHSLMHILSARSLQWVKERLQGSQLGLVDQLLYAPLKNAPLLLSNDVDRSSNLLNKQRQVRSVDKYFAPKDKAMLLELLEACYRRIYIGAFVCPLVDVQSLFEKYYYGISTNNQSMLSSISHSEYLIMNSALVLALSKFTSLNRVAGSQHPNLASLTTADAEQLRTKYFDNAMQEYNYVSKRNEGYRSLQGLALLSLFIEESFISDFHVNYIIVGTLVRYARELGLHRVEVLQDKDRDTGLACRKMWLFTEYMSVEVSYKSGKPMLINNEDVTTLSEVDPCIFSVPRDLFVNPDYEQNAPQLIESLKREGAIFYFCHFLLMLTRIKAKSYYKLYSKLPSSINTQGALTVVNEINDDMQTLARLIEPEVIRPHKDHPFVLSMFDCDEGILKFHVLLYHLSFHALMLSVNRVPFLEQFNIEDDRLLPYGNKSLVAARSILQAVSNPNLLWKVDDTSFPFLLFYPFIAFLSVVGNCLIYPTEASSYYDCLLLIDASLNFFAYNGPQSTNLDNKRVFSDMVTRSFLRILIDTMEKKANVYFYRMRPGLREHIESLQSKYPEMFQPESELKLSSPVQSAPPVSSSSSRTYNAGGNSIHSSQTANKMGQLHDNFDTGVPLAGEMVDLDKLLHEENFNQFVFGEINELSEFFNYDLSN